MPPAPLCLCPQGQAWVHGPRWGAVCVKPSRARKGVFSYFLAPMKSCRTAWLFSWCLTAAGSVHRVTKLQGVKGCDVLFSLRCWSCGFCLSFHDVKKWVKFSEKVGFRGVWPLLTPANKNTGVCANPHGYWLTPVAPVAPVEKVLGRTLHTPVFGRFVTVLLNCA